MTQIIVTLENNADSSLLQRMIENMKGVINTTLKRQDTSSADTAHEEWLKKVRQLGGSVDPSILDLNDERTRYILSK